MKKIAKIGIAISIAALLLFLSCLFGAKYQLTPESLHQSITDKKHLEQIEPPIASMMNKEYASVFSFVKDFHSIINHINEQNRAQQKWDLVIYTDYTFIVTKNSNYGFVRDHNDLLLALLLLCVLAGALLFIIPKYAFCSKGIHNNYIFFNKLNAPGWIGIVLGFLLISFYITLYFFPEYITNWVILVDPLSHFTNGYGASQWYLYGFLYTIAVVVMGIRMLLKYRGNLYQQVRTISVMFFQTAFAFIIPEILVALNKPWNDFKNIWPLDYTFFFDWRLNNFKSSGDIGWFMLFWGLALIIIAVPVFTYFFGKRWYCSWVCGCGGLAETLGDPFRQLSDKSLRAWKIERVVVHSVLVFAVIMTAITIINYSSHYKLLGDETQAVHKWYGFLIGSIFSGVVGTGFYPLMGNRVWCRFGCPLAAYIGLVQRFKSRFRITTNGGQCISCGNCSTYCEMGIDVRWYAQRGQNIVRSSCVGCGVCAAVCPRGVLRLENADEKGRFEFHPIG
ncbi:MAG TPA: 4Fe-4S dicluster domain-containing protein [Chitinophagales bacterium]|nr:4Fe-4S dicluster domain-containing protein [Chitinophagales bacterium]